MSTGAVETLRLVGFVSEMWRRYRDDIKNMAVDGSVSAEQAGRLVLLLEDMKEVCDLMAVAAHKVSS